MYNLLLELVKLNQKKRTFLDWKACLNLPEPLLCLFLVYRLRETWLWGTVQHRSLEKRRTAIKTLSERSDDSWVSSRRPSLDLLTVAEVENAWLRLSVFFPSTLPLLCKTAVLFPPLNGTARTHTHLRLRALWTFSVLLAHALFSPCESDVRNRLTEKYEQEEDADENKHHSTITHKLSVSSQPSSLSFFLMWPHIICGKTKRVIWAEGTNVVDHNNYSRLRGVFFLSTDMKNNFCPFAS